MIFVFPVCTICEEEIRSGSYRFGPDVSRKEGCHEAKKIAKANALEEYSRNLCYLIGKYDVMKGFGCIAIFYQIPVFTIHVGSFSFDKDLEEIEDFEVIKSVLYLEGYGLIKKEIIRIFYFSVNLNQSTFYDEELLHFEFQTNSKMCISIFHALSR